MFYLLLKTQNCVNVLKERTKNKNRFCEHSISRKKIHSNKVDAFDIEQ